MQRCVYSMLMSMVSLADTVCIGFIQCLYALLICDQHIIMKMNVLCGLSTTKLSLTSQDLSSKGWTWCNNHPLLLLTPVFRSVGSINVSVGASMTD